MDFHDGTMCKGIENVNSIMKEKEIIKTSFLVNDETLEDIDYFHCVIIHNLN